MIGAHSLDIIGRRAPSFLRSPYAETAESLNPPIHAGAQSRSGIQSTRIAAPDSRYERANHAAEATETARAPYDHLPWRAS